MRSSKNIIKEVPTQANKAAKVLPLWNSKHENTSDHGKVNENIENCDFFIQLLPYNTNNTNFTGK